MRTHMKHGLIKLAIFLALPSACSTVPSPQPAPPQTAAGDDFLARNAAAKGVVTTPSELQYFIVTSGPPTGRSPTTADGVVFDYEGKLTTGETFDSSYARGQPLSGKVSAFVPGFTEALMLMRQATSGSCGYRQPLAMAHGRRELYPQPACCASK